jgi:hypothetical protein
MNCEGKQNFGNDSRDRVSQKYQEVLERQKKAILSQPGTHSIDEFNETKQKIPKAQEDVLAQWCLELSSCNLPLDHGGLLEYANAVLQTTQLGDKLSSKWIDHFIIRHQDILGQQWTKPHEHI